MMFQFLIRPAGTDWKKDAQKIVEKLMGTAKEEEKFSLSREVGGLAKDVVVTAASPTPPEAATVKEPERPLFRFRSPGEENTLKAIERKMGKVAFDGMLRFLYIDRKDEFTMDNVHAAFGALRQFYTFDMNFFTPNMGTLTLHKKTFKIPIRPIRKVLLRRRRALLYQAYRERAMPSVPRRSFGLNLKSFTFSPEEIASIFHPPGSVVRAPKLQPLESRKSEPPVNLPVK